MERSQDMKLRRPLAIALTFLGVLGVTAVWAQRGTEGNAPRQLDPEVTTVRLLLGVGDQQSQTWGGKVKLDRGEVLGVEGYRFRKGDKVTGNDAWEAKTRRIRKAAPKK